MTNCDLCGKVSVVAMIDIEGARVSACEACMSHGTVVRRLDRSTAPPRAARASPTVEERVRSDLPQALRKARGHLTQEDFAKRLRVKLSAYHHYEAGSAVPDIETARRMERVIGSRLVELRTGVQEGPVAPAQGRRDVTIGDLIRRR